MTDSAELYSKLHLLSSSTSFEHTQTSRKLLYCKYAITIIEEVPDLTVIHSEGETPGTLPSHVQHVLPLDTKAGHLVDDLSRV